MTSLDEKRILELALHFDGDCGLGRNRTPVLSGDEIVQFSRNLLQSTTTNAAHRFDNEKRRRPDHHARQAMLTPPYVLEPVRKLLGEIGLDPCTEPDNPTGAGQFYCLPDDGCALPWDAWTVFCNPPYGEARDRWVDRCIAEAGTGKRIILLIPAHPDTRIFQRALNVCESVLFVRGRLKFGVLRENRRQEAASHGSAIIGFNVDLSPMGELGAVLPGRKKLNNLDLFVEPTT